MPAVPTGTASMASALPGLAHELRDGPQIGIADLAWTDRGMTAVRAGSRGNLGSFTVRVQRMMPSTHGDDDAPEGRPHPLADRRFWLGDLIPHPPYRQNGHACTGENVGDQEVAEALRRQGYRL